MKINIIRKYLCLFKIRFVNSLQYRAAALAGIATQFVWGMLTILLFRAFYESNRDAFPMEFRALVSYIWLQQSFLTLLAPWAYNTDIMDLIHSGNVAYELCRPNDLYSMWFVQNMATRVSKVCLRGLPILLLAFFFPAPYGFTFPVSINNFLLFLVSVILGHIVVVALNMLVFISSFYTTSSQGVRIAFNMVTDLLFGGLIPIPFFPPVIIKVLNYLPFSAIQNTPFLLYTGYYSINDALFNIEIQIVWIFILIVAGRLWLNHSLKRTVVLGG